MNMNKLLLVLAVPALWAAAPAAAVVPLVNSPITVTSADVGKSFTYNYNGIINEQNQAGLTSSIKFTLNSVSGTTWTFSALLDNTLSTAPVGARISSFGFNGNPEIIGATPISGPFGKAILDGKFPQTGGKTTIDFCLTDGSNCSGGASGGVLNNTTATQEFALSFANNITSVIFNNFIVRYQSVIGSNLGTSGVGMGTNDGGFDPGGDPVPEPSSWAMLIAGFGLIGAVARRRKAMARSITA
jgi:PEP-CTERM motif